MPRPATWRSPRGLLLVEAVMAATAIAVGLVAISRGLAGQLRALGALEAHEDAQAHAQGLLVEWESARLADRPLADQAAGGPDARLGLAWEVRAVRRSDLLDAAGEATAADVTLTVSRDTPPRTAIRLPSIWPVDWVPSSWW